MDTNKHEWGNLKRKPLTDLPIAHRYKSVACHLGHVPLRGERFAKRGRFVEERALPFEVDPFHKHENMAVRLVHDVGRLEFLRRRKPAANFGERDGGIALPRLPTPTNEAGTIDPDCLGACRHIIEPAFLRGVNVARRFSSFDSSIEARRRIVATPLVSDADILRIDQPTCFAWTTAPTVAIRRLHFDSISIFPMQNIRRRRLPPMLNVGFSDAQSFRAGDRLGVH
jgi:hypothetical protein